MVPDSVRSIADELLDEPWSPMRSVLNDDDDPWIVNGRNARRDPAATCCTSVSVNSCGLNSCELFTCAQLDAWT